MRTSLFLCLNFNHTWPQTQTWGGDPWISLSLFPKWPLGILLLFLLFTINLALLIELLRMRGETWLEAQALTSKFNTSLQCVPHSLAVSLVEWLTAIYSGLATPFTGCLLFLPSLSPLLPPSTSSNHSLPHKEIKCTQILIIGSAFEWTKTKELLSVSIWESFLLISCWPHGPESPCSCLMVFWKPLGNIWSQK